MAGKAANTGAEGRGNLFSDNGSGVREGQRLHLTHMNMHF